MAWVPTLKNGGNKIFRFYIDVTQFNRVFDQKVGGREKSLRSRAFSLCGGYLIPLFFKVVLTTVDVSI